ncbi:hypothetical protein [Mesorhizobium sp.]|uniref:hypothetical protein n=1 Tax=Mesorhizobium sp. TaxID=1871066 RepID=UPI000FE2EF5C|nr:hypothetical protein [Mesorhizobium sp.]RWN51922.1 MAG: hypothetical protein EOR98_24010 [Mesorhizobium sp.]RWN76251.1 MAG: hypothetical protein EOS01_21305 [Mesorhizobium sp.]RWN85998.1 MAG: hypothetical protein EOS04_20705 [Mesorhizobium sp.]RWO11762.1 MAG: hypothetical protein EOS15_21930 [Mesorhizobium sp.]
MSSPQNRVEAGLQRPDGLGARCDVVVTEHGPIDSSSAYAFGVRCHFGRRWNMVLQSAFDR